MIVVVEFCKEYVNGTKYRLATSQSEADRTTPSPISEYKEPQLAPNVVRVLNNKANRPES
jgi:hypothetical protein